MSIASARCKRTPALIDGLSWSALALVLAFCALTSLESMLSPHVGVFGSGRDMLLSWLVRIPIFMVMGVTVLITALVVLNAAGRAGRLNPVLAVAAAVAGCLVASVTRYAIGATPAADGPAFIVSAFISWFIPAAALVAGYVFYLHTRAVREEVNAAEMQQLETRLCLLQAQIEPHFLFNTLSNVRRLCQSDAGAGRTMLAQLARYLRAALPRMRDHNASLADEIELVCAFLGVQKIRMGARLESAIDVPASLLEARVPSMMLATLVENAIKHGIGPLAEGGAIRLAAAREGETLVLSVADTGGGFAAASGSGVGLANIRARLGAQYGERATLKLEANSPRGVLATIKLPWTRGEERS